MSILVKPTDQDIDQYPHVLLTSPHEWDPCVFYYAQPNTCRYPSWAPDHQLEIHMIPGLMNVETSKAGWIRHYPFSLKNTLPLSKRMFNN